jgi:hypothetical protein
VAVASWSFATCADKDLVVFAAANSNALDNANALYLREKGPSSFLCGKPVWREIEMPPGRIHVG